MPDIRVSDEVRALIGPELLRELEGDAYDRYDCWRCGGLGRTTDPTTVIVLGYQSTPMVKFAHANCVESQVVKLGVATPTDFDAAGFNDMRLKAAVLGYATEPRFRAVLVVEPHTELFAGDPGGERVNLWMTGLLEAGLTLMRTGGQLPDQAQDWHLLFSADETARLMTPDGVSVYDGPCPVWDDWRDVVREVGGCVVLVGTIGLYALTDDELTTLRFQQLLNRAARAGVLVGGIVMPSWP